MDLFKMITGFLWKDSFWLPPNMTWIDMQSTPEKTYPQLHALLYPIPLALVIFFVRLLVEKIVYEPLGNMLRIPGRRAKPVPRHATLESAYKKSKRPTHHEIVGLAKQCDMSERQVERWFRHRESEGKSHISQLDKFKETGWRFSFYLGIFLYGIWANCDKPWFLNSDEFWTGYPYQTVDPEIWWYYMLELGFYWSLLISQFFDVKRKDFWEMFFHHIITICLMCFSWTDNCIRVGAMVLLIHDAVDFWLEILEKDGAIDFCTAAVQAAKLAKYARQSWSATLSGALFGIFALVWVITRLMVYPYRILRSTIPCPLGDKCFPGFTVFNVLLSSLQVLHVFWTFTIAKVLVRALSTGKTEDVRSDTEESAGENESSTTHASDDSLSPSAVRKRMDSTGDASGDKLRHNGNNGYCNMAATSAGDIKGHTNGSIRSKLKE